MKSDDILLMAHVDGELPPHEHEEVERELRTSPDMAECVALLRASRLPYRDAFAGQTLPPLPPSLSAKIEEMARAAKAKAAHPGAGPNVSPDVSVNDPVVPHAPGSTSSSPIRSRLRVAPAWLGVAFLAGAFACGLVLRLGTGAGPASNALRGSCRYNGTQRLLQRRRAGRVRLRPAGVQEPTGCGPS